MISAFNCIITKRTLLCDNPIIFIHEKKQLFWNRIHRKKLKLQESLIKSKYKKFTIQDAYDDKLPFLGNELLILSNVHFLGKCNFYF